MSLFVTLLVQVFPVICSAIGISRNLLTTRLEACYEVRPCRRCRCAEMRARMLKRLMVKTSGVSVSACVWRLATDTTTPLFPAGLSFPNGKQEGFNFLNGGIDQ